MRKFNMKTGISLSLLTIVGLFIIAGTLRSDLKGAAKGMIPRVTAITQVTHDGYRKANLLSDDSNLFVTELPEANRIIAKVTLPGSERSVLPRNRRDLVGRTPEGSSMFVRDRSTQEVYQLSLDLP